MQRKSQQHVYFDLPSSNNNQLKIMVKTMERMVGDELSTIEVTKVVKIKDITGSA